MCQPALSVPSSQWNSPNERIVRRAVVSSRQHDLLVVHPNEAHSLRVACGDKLQDMLVSAGVGMFANPSVTGGTASAIEKGKVGAVCFEFPLTVDAWEDKAIRSWWVHAYVVPAFGVDRPFAAKKLTGLAG